MSRGMKYAIAGVVVVVMGMMAMMVVAIGVLGYMVYSNRQLPTPPPTPVVVESQITTILDAHDEDARKLAGLHNAIADVIESDEAKAIKTTGDIRQVNGIAGRLCLGTSLKGKHAGLQEALDKVIEQSLGGRQSRALTDADRVAVVAAFRSIAAAEMKAAE